MITQKVTLGIIIEDLNNLISILVINQNQSKKGLKLLSPFFITYLLKKKQIKINGRPIRYLETIKTKSLFKIKYVIPHNPLYSKYEHNYCLYVRS